MNLDSEQLRTLAEVRAFLDGSDPVDFRRADRDDAYTFVRRPLVRSRYPEWTGRRRGAQAFPGTRWRDLAGTAHAADQPVPGHGPDRGSPPRSRTAVRTALDGGRRASAWPRRTSDQALSYANVATPYEKLKPGVSFAELDALALSVSDLDAAAAVNTPRTESLIGDRVHAHVCMGSDAGTHHPGRICPTRVILAARWGYGATLDIRSAEG